MATNCKTQSKVLFIKFIPTPPPHESFRVVSQLHKIFDLADYKKVNKPISTINLEMQ